MRSENFVVIQGWMCNELNLKGNDLLVFALIYGFSQDEISEFHGGRKYIAETFNISLPTVDKALQNLLSMDLIDKVSSGDHINPDTYFVRNEVVKELYGGGKDSLPGGSKDSLHDIYNNKIKNNNTLSKDNVLRESLHDNDYLGTENEKPKKKNLYQKCLDMIYEFTNDGKLTELLIQYLNLLLEKSKNESKPLYANQFKGMLNKLDEICTDGHYGEVVQQSIVKGYIGFFPVNNYSSKAQNYVPDTNKAPQHHAGEKVKNKDGTLKEY